MTTTPRTDAETWTETNRANACVFAEFARQLETELTHAKEEANNWKQAAEAHLKDKDQLREGIAELNGRLIDRQETLMTASVALKKATQLLTRCSASKQMSLLLQDDIRDFLKSQPSYRC